MRAVFQPPASIVSVVLAPRTVSSDARPTRPEWPVIRPSMPPSTGAVASGRRPDRRTVRRSRSLRIAEAAPFLR